MDFSEAYRFSGPPPAFSPDGTHVAIVVEYRVAVRDSETFKVVQLFSCVDKVHQIEWSRDGLYLMCTLVDRAVVQVWSVNEPQWSCKIDEGPAGIQVACWVPGSRNVLTVADFSIRASVWSLTTRTCVHLPGPKDGAAGVVFSKDGSQLLLVERTDCKDYISILATADWQVGTKFMADTSDLAGAAWSPDGKSIAVWDTSLTYKLLVYTPKGQCLASYSAYPEGLGIRSVTWAPSGQLLSVGSYDQVARLLNHVTWTPLLACEHSTLITASGSGSVIVYKEVEELLNSSSKSASEMRSKYSICKLPVAAPTQLPPLQKPNPSLGIGQQSWSPDGAYLVTINANMPTVAWVWSMATMQLATVLIHAQPLKSFAWAPGTKLSLALCTGSSRVYFWSPTGASIVHIPLTNFQAHSMSWQSSGRAFLLSDRDTTCCAYSVND